MTTRTPTRPRPTHGPVDTGKGGTPAPGRRRPGVELSLTQIMASAFAAVTATVAGSYLGVTGTVLGAALASVVTVTGNAVYSSSLRRTRDRVRAVVPAPRRRLRRPTPTGARTRPLPPVADGPPALPSPSPRRRDPRPASRTTPWRTVALASIGVFTAVLAGVTVVEVVAGRPLSDLVRDDGGSGTSLFGGSNSGGTQPAVPVPTVTTTVTPSVEVVTPTVTQTAPAATMTVTPTTTSTATTPASTPTPTSTPTSSTSSAAGADAGTPSTLG